MQPLQSEGSCSVTPAGPPTINEEATGSVVNVGGNRKIPMCSGLGWVQFLLSAGRIWEDRGLRRSWALHSGLRRKGTDCLFRYATVPVLKQDKMHRVLNFISSGKKNYTLGRGWATYASLSCGAPSAGKAPVQAVVGSGEWVRRGEGQKRSLCIVSWPILHYGSLP